MKFLNHEIKSGKKFLSFLVKRLSLCHASVLLLACGFLHAQPAQIGSAGGSIRGIVKSGNMLSPVQHQTLWRE